MLSVAEAEQCIRDNTRSFGTRACELDGAVGAILREDVAADRDLPPYDRVTMDGIAISHEAINSGQQPFVVQETLAAGQPAPELVDQHNCIEVMTGAVLPSGCDCVIPVERIETASGQAVLESGYRPEVGQHIHHQGSDYPRGTVLLHAGMRLRPPDIAVLASVGKKTVSVAQEPKIAIVTTGDELVEIDATVLAHQVRRSNDHAIAATLCKDGLSDFSLTHVPDDRDQIESSIRNALHNCDVVILSGGVSMGKFDYLPEVLENTDVRQVFHNVSQRPGKPMWFGVGPGEQSVFALPGNPVSALVCMRRFVVPALRRAAGMAPTPSTIVRLAEMVRFKPELTWFLPVCLHRDDDGQIHAEPRPPNTSGDFATLSKSDGFVELERDRAEFPRGHTATFFEW